MPSVETIGSNMRRRLAGFVRTLRDNGFAVGLAETRDALSILASPAAAQPALLQPALRALFCATHSDWERFDEILAGYWLGRGMRRVQRATGSSAQSRRSTHRPAAAVARGSPDHVEAGDGGTGDRVGGRRGDSTAR